MTANCSSQPPAVRIQNLSYRYPDGTTALDALSLEIRPGESVCLAGPNGAGKSTLLLILAGLLRTKAEVSVCGVAPAANRQFGLVFQHADDQLFCATVAEDVAFGPRNQKLKREDVDRRVQEALSATGLTGCEARCAHHLSGGEKKRAAIAAVLACKPNVLALDEPWANLDVRGARAVMKIIREFQGTRIVTSQDLYRASEVCDRIVILDDGKFAADGPIGEILKDESLLESHGLEYGRICRFCGKRG